MGMQIADDRPFQPSSDIQGPSITMECLVSLWYLANKQTWSGIMFGCITRTLNCRYKRMNTNANINFIDYRLTHLERTFVSWGVNIHSFKNKQTISLFAIKSSQLACCIFKYALLQHLPVGWTCCGHQQFIGVKEERAYLVQTAPALCGVWGRVSVASLTLACAMRGDRNSNPRPSGHRR